MLKGDIGNRGEIGQWKIITWKMKKLNKWNREENKVNCEMKKTGNRNQVEV